MALKKSYTFKGIPCEYWIIINLELMKLTNRTKITLGLFVNSNTRDISLNNFVLSRIFEFSGVDKTRTDAYTYLKTLIDFENAEDC
jgi:hypothetical protein